MDYHHHIPFMHFNHPIESVLLTWINFFVCTFDDSLMGQYADQHGKHFQTKSTFHKNINMASHKQSATSFVQEIQAGVKLQLKHMGVNNNKKTGPAAKNFHLGYLGQWCRTGTYLWQSPTRTVSTHPTMAKHPDNQHPPVLEVSHHYSCAPSPRRWVVPYCSHHLHDNQSSSQCIHVSKRNHGKSTSAIFRHLQFHLSVRGTLTWQQWATLSMRTQ